MKVWWLLILTGCAPTEKASDAHADPEPTEAVSDSAMEDTGLAPGSSPDTGTEDHPYDSDGTDPRSALGCAQCHPTQFSEWQQSMHRYAAHSPVFDEMTAKAVRDTAGATGTFCTGCHTPLGTMDGEPGNTKAKDRSDISLEGVTCVVCHQTVDYQQPVGNTHLVLDLDAPMQGPFEPVSDAGHASVKGDIIDTPELCGSCHDVFNFPGLRIEEAYTEYKNSPAADMGLRCQDCHMSAEPGVPTAPRMGPAAVVAGIDLPDRELSSHRFVGPDYSLLDSFPYPDDEAASMVAQAEMLGQIQTLLENAVRISDASLEESTESSILRVVVENQTSGHNVPTGFTSERQLWLHVQVMEGDEVVWSSGDLDSFGDLRDELSWEVSAGLVDHDEQLVNFQSQNLMRVGDFTVALPDVYETMFPFDADFIVRRSLAPLEARTLEYTLPAITDTARIEVALKYRNLPPYILRALQLDDIVDRLKIFTIDQTTLEGSK
jgi:nitrate/TMAO reductase-like tetraheme cytochrome c subunit